MSDDDRTDDTTPAGVGEEGAPEPEPEEKRHFKEGFRETLGKIVGIAVETGSMLSGNAGPGVSAEGEVAEADTEKFIDRIDGED